MALGKFWTLHLEKPWKPNKTPAPVCDNSHGLSGYEALKKMTVYTASNNRPDNIWFLQIRPSKQALYQNEIHLKWFSRSSHYLSTEKRNQSHTCPAFKQMLDNLSHRSDQKLRERQNVLRGVNDHTPTESYGLHARTMFSDVLVFLQTDLCRSLPSREERTLDRTLDRRDTLVYLPAKLQE